MVQKWLAFQNKLWGKSCEEKQIFINLPMKRQSKVLSCSRLLQLDSYYCINTLIYNVLFYPRHLCPVSSTQYYHCDPSHRCPKLIDCILPLLPTLSCPRLLSHVSQTIYYHCDPTCLVPDFSLLSHRPYITIVTHLVLSQTSVSCLIDYITIVTHLILSQTSVSYLIDSILPV